MANVDRSTVLPIEVWNMIIEPLFTDDEFEKEASTLKSLSLVSKHLRHLCLPHLFRTLQIDFLESSFKHLLLVSGSDNLAPLVRRVRYRAPLLLKPGECFI
jgi:hypothetical protein